MIFLPKLFVMLKILSLEYQLYACGKIFRIPRFWDENLHFARGSEIRLFPLTLTRSQGEGIDENKKVMNISDVHLLVDEIIDSKRSPFFLL